MAFSIQLVPRDSTSYDTLRPIDGVNAAKMIPTLCVNMRKERWLKMMEHDLAQTLNCKCGRNKFKVNARRSRESRQ